MRQTTLALPQVLDRITASAFSPEAQPEACRDCGGVQYYRPSAAPPKAAPARSNAPSDVPASTSPTFKGSHLSSDSRIRTARALVHDKRFAEALKILRPLASDHPDQTDVRFLLGLAASRGSQTTGLEEEIRLALLDEAIAAFRSILIRQPGLVRVRLELALAFYLKEEDGLAEDHFERALVGKPPEGLVANITRFLKVMRARRRWNGYFGFSVAPDTNINAASDAEFIYIQGLPFRRGQTGRASSDIGIVGWGGGEYQYPLADRWRLRTGINLNHREYKGSRWDQTFVSGYVGPRWLITPATEVSLLATVEPALVGRLQLELRLRRAPGSVAPGLRGPAAERPGLVERPQIPATESSWKGRSWCSPWATYVLFPTVQVNALVGYQQQDAISHSWSSAGYWTRVGTNVALPWGFTVGASAEFRWTDYEAGWFPFVEDNGAREDQTRILQATLLNRAITVFGFSPQIVFSNQVRESNAQLFDFKRNLVEMRWVRQF